MRTALVKMVKNTLISYAAFALAACSGGRGGGGPAPNPVPTLSSVSPSSIASGSPGVVLTLQGTGFLAASTVQWNGSPLPNTSWTPTQLTAQVPASSLLTLGTVSVNVQNPGPGGGTATALPVRVGGPLWVSVPVSGATVDGGTVESDISLDGRYVAFASGASNLVSADTNAAFDVFVRDTCLGAPPGCVPVTQRVSVASDGTEGNFDSGYTPTCPELCLAISGSGRYVAFVSGATNLVAGDTNSHDDVFVRDTCIGATGVCTPTTTLVAVGVGGAPAFGGSASPAVSRSGRFVAFGSSADDLVVGDGNFSGDMFVRDTCAGAPPGCTPSTSRASVAGSGAEANASSGEPAFSGDERYLAFASLASNLVAGDTNAATDIFLRDTCFGASGGCAPSTVRVSLTDAGGEANDHSRFPKVSLHGRYVAFVTGSSNLVAGDTNGLPDLYIRDTCLNAPPPCTPTTILASRTNAGTPAGVDGTRPAALSDDGRYAAFQSGEDVFVRDTCNSAPAGCVPSTTRLSAAFDGTPANNPSFDPAVSGDGRFISFTSWSTNLVPGGVPPPAGGNGHIYVAPAH